MSAMYSVCVYTVPSEKRKRDTAYTLLRDSGYYYLRDSKYTHSSSFATKLSERRNTMDGTRGGWWMVRDFGDGGFSAKQNKHTKYSC